MKYLIYIGPGIGDFIIALPMAKTIKEHDPNSFIKVFMRSNKKRILLSKQLFELQNFIDELDYYSIHEPIHSIFFLLKNGFHKFDYGFVSQYIVSGASLMPSKIANICAKKTCGRIDPNNSDIKYDVEMVFEAGMPVRNYSLRMLEAVGMPIDTIFDNLIDKKKLPKITLPKEYKSERKTVTLCMGTAPVGIKTRSGVFNYAKSWPYNYWKKLAEGLAANGINVILLGGKTERENMGDFHSQNTGIFNYVGITDIKGSLSLLNMSDLVVGADTGLMHCAGALGKNSLTLFGCTDYREYLPLGPKSEYISSEEPCSPCFGTEKAVLCKHISCMKRISVDQVLNKIHRILNA